MPIVPTIVTSEIGTEIDNRRFLAWLEEHGQTEMIARGCTLCRVIGHPFTEHCRP